MTDKRSRRDAESAEAERRRYAQDPPCLVLGDPLGGWLIDRVIEHYGSQALVGDRLGISVGSLNRYRAERYLSFDMVDRLLTMIYEPQRLDEFDFAPRSQRRAEAKGRPLVESIRKKREAERHQRDLTRAANLAALRLADHQAQARQKVAARAAAGAARRAQRQAAAAMLKQIDDKRAAKRAKAALRRKIGGLT